MALPARSSWYSRLFGTVRGTWTRSVAYGLAALRRSPPRGGVSSGRVASPINAERDLSAIESSPAVFAGVTRLALSFTTFPVRVYMGFSVGGDKSLTPISSDVPWVAAFLRLLQTPDHTNADDLAPEPGDGLFAQIVADLGVAGIFFVAPTVTDAGDVIGLRRLHPKLCTFERAQGQEWVVYRTPTDTMWYPRRSVFVGRLPGWAADGRGELGSGAGAALHDLNTAEATALRQTALITRQGGADLRIVAADAAGAALLRDKPSREKLVREATEALEGENGRRVYALGGNVRIEDAGLKPADLQAEALLQYAPNVQLMALGVVPAAVGRDASNYANGVLQWRAQADMDEGRAQVIEAYFLRPLARRFCRRFGGRMAQRLDEITARHDLSSHIGYAYVRTDAYTRAIMLVESLGYTVEQAVAAEQLDLPKPLGTPRASTQPGTPGPATGSSKPEPRRPVGDGGDPAPPRSFEPIEPAPLGLSSLFGRENAEILAK